MLVVCQFRYTRTRVQKSAFSTNALKEMRSEVQRTEYAERTNERTSRDAEQLSLNLQPDTEAATHAVRQAGRHRHAHRARTIVLVSVSYIEVAALCISFLIFVIMYLYAK